MIILNIIIVAVFTCDTDRDRGTALGSPWSRSSLSFTCVLVLANMIREGDGICLTFPIVQEVTTSVPVIPIPVCVLCYVTPQSDFISRVVWTLRRHYRQCSCGQSCGGKHH